MRSVFSTKKLGAVLTTVSAAAMFGVMAPGTAQAYQNPARCSDWKAVSQNVSAKICQDIYLSNDGTRSTVNPYVIVWSKRYVADVRVAPYVANEYQNIVGTGTEQQKNVNPGPTKFAGSSSDVSNYYNNDVQSCATVYAEGQVKWLCTSAVNAAPRLF